MAKNNSFYIQELNLNDLDTSNPAVNYTDGDVAILESRHDIRDLQPLYMRMNFIIFCIKGRIQFDVNGRTLLVQAGELMLSPSNVLLDKYLVSVDFECKVLCLSDYIVQGLLQQSVSVWNRAVYMDWSPVLKLSVEDRRQLANFYTLLHHEIKHQYLYYQREIMQSVIRGLLFYICSCLQRESEESPAPQSQEQRLFNSFLDLLTHETVKRRPLTYYAGKLAVTAKYLTVVCKRFSGKGASAWVDQYVVGDVRYYLCYTNYSIKEVAAKLGFSNESFFGTFVKRHLGMSPRELRNHQKR